MAVEPSADVEKLAGRVLRGERPGKGDVLQIDPGIDGRLLEVGERRVLAHVVYPGKG